MHEMISQYVGRECIIYFMSTQVYGIIEQVEEKWVSVKTNSGTDLINLDYIYRIREYPRDKNGKKKTFFI